MILQSCFFAVRSSELPLFRSSQAEILKLSLKRRVGTGRMTLGPLRPPRTIGPLGPQRARPTFVGDERAPEFSQVPLALQKRPAVRLFLIVPDRGVDEGRLKGLLHHDELSHFTFESFYVVPRVDSPFALRLSLGITYYGQDQKLYNGLKQDVCRPARAAFFS